jgi:hypothetical protein
MASSFFYLLPLLLKAAGGQVSTCHSTSSASAYGYNVA